MSDLRNFLDSHRAITKNDITHTSINYPKGSFCIPTEEYDTFMDLYCSEVFNNIPAYLTERHMETVNEGTNECVYWGPVLIDLDFKFEHTDENKKRRFKVDLVKSLVGYYNQVIRQILNVTDEQLISIVTMRKSPYATEYHKKPIIKDGLHIVYPFITTLSKIQHVIRQKMIEIAEQNNLFEKLPLTNELTDIFDDGIIDKTNWQVYGSTKPGIKPYKLKYILNANCEEVPHSTYSNRELVQITSLRYGRSFEDLIMYKNDTVQAEIEQEYGKLLARKKKIKRKTIPNRYNNLTDPSQIGLATILDEVEYKDLDLDENGVENGIIQTAPEETIKTVERLVDMLSVKRATEFKAWMEVCWCLRNIDPVNLFGTFVKFSQRCSDKFNLNECKEKWKEAASDHNGLKIGTLHMWAKEDNLNEYKQLESSNVRSLIYASLDESHVGVAQVVYEMYKHEFVCVDIQKKKFYFYYNHRWRPNVCGSRLRKKIIQDVVDEYRSFEDTLRRKNEEQGKSAADDNDGFQKKAAKVSLRLRNTNFLNNVITECANLFFDEEFMSKLDENHHLVGFENGVMDLNTHMFRAGRPDDYISFSTGIKYIHYDINNSKIRAVVTFLSQVLPDDDKREYALQSLSRCLHGGIKEELFHMWTGEGGNGKSCLVRLCEMGFGDYSIKLPITLLTNKRAASNVASPELSSAKGKRFATMQEPEGGARLNCALMKEMTGGDVMRLRGLYKDCEDIIPQFKVQLICNDLPDINSLDGGTWRRLRVIEFTSRFKSNPDPKNPNEFPIDSGLSEKLKVWNEAFMSILVEYYRKYKQGGLPRCHEVIKYTENYQMRNDFYLKFIRECVVEDPKGKMKLRPVYSIFKDWFKEVQAGNKIPKMDDFRYYMEKRYGEYDRRFGWKGYRAQLLLDDNEASDEDD